MKYVLAVLVVFVSINPLYARYTTKDCGVYGSKECSDTVGRRAPQKPMNTTGIRVKI